MYWLCKGMEWNHLPVAGGLYDQHPRFIEDMAALIQMDNEYQNKKHRERERKQAAKSAQSRNRRR